MDRERRVPSHRLRVLPFELRRGVLGSLVFLRPMRTRLPDPRVFDPYAVLGVTSMANTVELTRAWRRAAKDNHPDKFQAPGESVEATARFQLAQSAWNLVGTTSNRETWDYHVATVIRSFRGGPTASPTGRQAKGSRSTAQGDREAQSSNSESTRSSTTGQEHKSEAPASSERITMRLKANKSKRMQTIRVTLTYLQALHGTTVVLRHPMGVKSVQVEIKGPVLQTLTYRPRQPIFYRWSEIVVRTRMPRGWRLRADGDIEYTLKRTLKQRTTQGKKRTTLPDGRRISVMIDPAWRMGQYILLRGLGPTISSQEGPRDLWLFVY